MQAGNGAAGVSTDIRRRYAALIDALLREGRKDLADQAARLAVEQGVWANPLQRPVDYVRYGGDRPVYDPQEFWFVPFLEENAPLMQAELARVSGGSGSGGSGSGGSGSGGSGSGGSGSGGVFTAVEEPLLDAGRWDQVVLYEAGRRQERACAMLPVTAGIMEQIPEATTFGPGVVTLSAMQPGTHVIPHCGRTNAQVRVHLGLDVPPGVSIRVGEEKLTWENGRCIAFDDSFEHEVWHTGDRQRIVLLFDVLNPCLDERQRSRQLAMRGTATEKIAAYLAEHDIRRVEVDGSGVLLRPSDGMSSMVRRYMDETGASAVEMRDRTLHFEHP